MGERMPGWHAKIDHAYQFFTEDVPGLEPGRIAETFAEDQWELYDDTDSLIVTVKSPTGVVTRWEVDRTCTYEAFAL